MTDYEFFETPEAMTRYLFRRYPALLQGSRLYEPCVGSGAILRGSGIPRERWQTNDLDPRWHADTYKDATGLDYAGIQAVVTNPPFSLAWAIAQRAVDQVPLVAMYLRISFHEVAKTGRKAQWLRNHRPAALLFLPRFAHQRSKKTGDYATDTVTCCWTIWDSLALSPTVDYADDQCLRDLKQETPGYRERLDRLMLRRTND